MEQRPSESTAKPPFTSPTMPASTLSSFISALWNPYRYRALETEAISCPVDSPRRLHLLYAAAAQFSHRASHELLAYWRESNEMYAPEVAAYWKVICYWLPLNPAEDSMAAKFYDFHCNNPNLDTQQAQVELRGLFALAKTHPIALYTGCMMGTFHYSDANWELYEGRHRSGTSLALICYAICREQVKASCLTANPSTKPPPETREVRTNATLRLALFAGRIACLLGNAEAALFLLDICGPRPSLLPLLYPASAQDLRVSLALQLAMRSNGPLPAGIVTHEKLLASEGWSLSDIPTPPIMYPNHQIRDQGDTIDFVFSQPIATPLQLKYLRVGFLPAMVTYSPPEEATSSTQPPQMPVVLSFAKPVSAQSVLPLTEPISSLPLHTQSSGTSTVYANVQPITQYENDPPHALAALYANVGSPQPPLKTEGITVHLPGVHGLWANENSNAALRGTAVAPFASLNPSAALIAADTAPQEFIDFGDHPTVHSDHPIVASAPLCRDSSATIQPLGHPMLHRRIYPTQWKGCNWDGHSRREQLPHQTAWCCDLHSYSYTCAGCCPPGFLRLLSPSQFDILRSSMPDVSALRVWIEVLLSLTVVAREQLNYTSCRTAHPHSQCHVCFKRITAGLHHHAIESVLRLGCDIPQQLLPNLQPLLCDECAISELDTPGKSLVSLVNFERIVRRIIFLQAQCKWVTFAVTCFAHLGNALRPHGVSTSQWAEMCAWFGPADNKAFWLRIAWLTSQRCGLIVFGWLVWFYGRLSTTDAAGLVAQHTSTAGAWLFRFSSSERGGFAFTVADKGGKVTHYRVSREWTEGEKNGTYVLRMKPTDRRYTSLSALLQGAAKELSLGVPLCGSPVFGQMMSDAVDSTRSGILASLQEFLLVVS